MEEQVLPLSTIENDSSVDTAAVYAILKEEIRKRKDKIIVLDDDPTGVQTVHDIYVYTDWTKERIHEAFLDGNRASYLLTNSRGMTTAQTKEVHQEIIKNLTEVSEELGTPFLLISRSDSTLRGHYPLEMDTLRKGLEEAGLEVDGEILCPFFKEGGRYTIQNVHYVQQEMELVPAANTEFAKDVTFSYHHSALPEYVEEKTEGQYPASKVICIQLEDIRACKYEKITEQLLTVKGFNKICVNAVDDSDLMVFCVALYRAMGQGKRFLFRTAASFVKVFSGIENKALLTREEMILDKHGNGGIVVIGSHTEKTTTQLKQLLNLDNVVEIPFDSDKVLRGEEIFNQEVERCIGAAEEAIRSGKTAVCYTSRKLLSVKGENKEETLIRSVKISEGVQRLVGELGVEPAFVLAKGGITSSDIGTKALRVKRARVLGQICPGVPVWQTGKESKFPGIPYIIFPGNTGNEESLKKAVEILLP